MQSNLAENRLQQILNIAIFKIRNILIYVIIAHSHFFKIVFQKFIFKSKSSFSIIKMRSCFYIFPGIFPAVLTAYFHQIRQKTFFAFSLGFIQSAVRFLIQVVKSSAVVRFTEHHPDTAGYLQSFFCRAFSVQTADLPAFTRAFSILVISHISTANSSPPIRPSRSELRSCAQDWQ